jgi:hypothetical protein
MITQSSLGSPRVPRGLLAVFLLVFLGACASNGPGSPFKDAPDAQQYSSMNEEEREAAAANVQQTAAERRAWWNDIGEPIFLAGEPVKVGTPDSGYTMHWVPKMGMTYIYPGHLNGAMGMEQSAIMAIATNEDGDFIQENTRGGGVRPVVLTANIATQEGLGRFLTRGLFQMGGAALNGAVAAQIHANDDCGENCGNIVLQNGSSAGASAGASSDATGTGNASSSSGGGGCVTCGMLQD